jgi:molybdenum cofactor cytidylyltransferase
VIYQSISLRLLLLCGMKESQIAIIILAAGSSERMSSPKQLLPYLDTSLLRYITQTALQSHAQKVYVVVGYKAEEMFKGLAELPIEILLNPEWKNGLSTSLHVGLQKLDKESDAAIILLCDQPKVTSSLLNTLIDSYLEVQQPIVACRYGDTVGVPALFDRSIFPELLALRGDVGAKRIIEQYASKRTEIDFPEGIYDIDSDDDFHSLH